jgi:hypothetical protein
MLPKLGFGYQTSDQERYERELHIKSEKERERERERERDTHTHTHTHTHTSQFGKLTLLNAPKLGFGQESVKLVPVCA